MKKRQRRFSLYVVLIFLLWIFIATQLQKTPFLWISGILMTLLVIAIFLNDFHLVGRHKILYRLFILFLYVIGAYISFLGWNFSYGLDIFFFCFLYLFYFQLPGRNDEPVSDKDERSFPLKERILRGIASIVILAAVTFSTWFIFEKTCKLVWVEDIYSKIQELPTSYSLADARKDGFIILNGTSNRKNDNIENFVQTFETDERKKMRLVTMDNHSIIHVYRMDHSDTPFVIHFSYDVKAGKTLASWELFQNIRREKSANGTEVILYQEDQENADGNSSTKEQMIYCYQ